MEAKMRMKCIHPLIITILLLLTIITNAQDSAWIDVRFEEPVWNPDETATITAEVWARANVGIEAGSLGLVVNRRLVTADTCYFGPEMNWLVSYYISFTDSVFPNGDTLTFFLMGGIDTYSGQGVFPANTDVLYGTVEMTFITDSLPVIQNGALEFWLDSSFIPPGANFILTDEEANDISPEFTTDTILIMSGFMCGDANADQIVNVGDAVWLVNYVFIGGDPPIPMISGDVNCDGKISLVDIIFVVNNVFRSGFDPCDINGDGIPDC
jgi:Dockerin type I domain